MRLSDLHSKHAAAASKPRPHRGILWSVMRWSGKEGGGRRGWRGDSVMQPQRWRVHWGRGETTTTTKKSSNTSNHSNAFCNRSHKLLGFIYVRCLLRSHWLRQKKKWWHGGGKAVERAHFRIERGQVLTSSHSPAREEQCVCVVCILYPGLEASSRGAGLLL